MADQVKHPLIDALVGLLATPQGQSLAKDFLSARDMASDATEYAMDAPSRAIADIQDPQQLTPENVVSKAGDLALLLAGGAGVAGIGKAAYAGLKSGAPRFKDVARMIPGGKPIGPELTKDATNYTGQNTEIARDVMRKQLTDPSRNMTSQTLAKEAGEQFAKRSPNVPPNIDGLAKSTMRRLPEDLDLSNPAEVERAIKMATGWRKGGKATSLGLGGAAAGGAMSDDEIDALLAEIMGGGR